MKVCKLSPFSKSKDKTYQCKFPWPPDSVVQAGDNGMVLSKRHFEESFENGETAVRVLTGDLPHYRTAFFEAFLKSPDTFLRGEGKDLETAELEAWKKFQRYKDCVRHCWITRGYTNGAGFCKFCGLFKSQCFKPKPSTKSELMELHKRFGDVAATIQQIEAAPDIQTWKDPGEVWDELP